MKDIILMELFNRMTSEDIKEYNRPLYREGLISSSITIITLCLVELLHVDLGLQVLVAIALLLVVVLRINNALGERNRVLIENIVPRIKNRNK